MTEEAIAIRVRDLVVGFGDRIVIDHLSLDVRAGEILGLVGASGGGKSVLMRTLIGLLPKRSGTIEFPLASAEASTPRGVLFQQGALFSALNARQNVQFPLARGGASFAGAARRDRQCQAGDGGFDCRTTARNFRRSFRAA